MLPFFSIKNLKRRKKVMEFFFSINNCKSRKKVTECFFTGHASLSFHMMHNSLEQCFLCQLPLNFFDYK